MVQAIGKWIWGALCVCLLAHCVPQPVYHSRPAKVEKSRPVAGTAQRSRNKKPPAVVRPTRTAHALDPAKISTKNAYQIGTASYYGEKFHGKPTASGEKFNMYKLTAAHRVLPLGTVVKVTHIGNGHWVEVKVNDRGPFVEGRILDLSFAAALELEMVKTGTAKVMIEIVKKVD